MGVHSILLSLVVLVFLDNSLANPLLEFEIEGRTLFQQNMKCGTKSAYKRITMTNPTNALNQNCLYTIRAYSTKVCQVRIDFFTLDLEKPQPSGSRLYSYCSGERVIIEGMLFDLCGRLNRHHVYVPFNVEKISQEMKINFQLSSNSYAAWNMEINQIECNHKAALVTPDIRQAPDGCLQYFYESFGRVESFNFLGGQYYGNTKYAICFNRNNNEKAVLELSDIEFEMDSVGATGFDSDCLNNVATASKDYIAIPFADVGGDPYSLFCGTSLDGEELTYDGAGPIVIHVNTDRIPGAAGVEKGFRFMYNVS